MTGDFRGAVMSIGYIAAALGFILGIKRLSSPATARSGNRLAAGGMLLALLVTLLDRQVLSFWEIALGTAIGAAVGITMARRVQMTAMPQMVALFNGMGGATAALVSVAEYLRASGHGEAIGVGHAVSIALGTAIGAISFTGSLIAFGKLQELLSGKPLLFRGEHILNGLVALGIVLIGFTLAVGRTGSGSLWILFALALVLGVLFVMPIGGGDMPVVISVLNSMTGVAAALTGIVLSNQLLVVAGMLVGASGTLLTLLMSRAMNRPLTNVIFGGFGATTTAEAAVQGKAGTVRQTNPEDAAIAMAYASSIVVVPGYGLAVAEGQHALKDLARELEKQGVTVRYAIHPVAGRMPGHLNVILSEAEIPYDALVGDIEEANALLESADVALVVGANDIVNPSALTDPASPIFGMPIFDVRKARTVMVLKRSMASGFAGIENPLFHEPNTVMLFGDAKSTIKNVVGHVRALEGAAHFH